MVHCVPSDGYGVNEQLCTLLLNCSDISQMTANFILNGSPFQEPLLRLCAEVCEACAKACSGIEDFEECIAACYACAEACHALAAQAWNNVSGEAPGAASGLHPIHL